MTVNGPLKVLEAPEVEWADVGRKLRRIDPVRYARLLVVALQVIEAHTGELSPVQAGPALAWVDLDASSDPC